MVYTGEYDKEMMEAANLMSDIVHSERFHWYECGYRQAERELSLRWEDVRLMCNIANELTEKGLAVPDISIKEFYQIVLERYKEEKRDIDYE